MRSSSVRSAAIISAAATLGLPLLLTGCQKKEVAAAPSQPVKPAAPAQLSEIDLKSYKPNEAGAIMIIMYHRFNTKEKPSDLNRTPEQFRKDLQTFYDLGYRPVNVSDIAENRIDVPAGKTPIALTFDDSLPSQFNIVTGADGQPHIDPDCAVGMMEQFHKEHADWPLKGTFFVLPREGRNGDPFGKPDTVADKFAYLLKSGYEIANHTATHTSLRGKAADKVQWEIATAVKDIKQIAPEAQMKTLALPYGNVPRKDSTPVLVSGESGGTSYKNVAVLRAAWRPVASPITKAGKRLVATGQIAAYNRYSLERITPDSRHPNTAGTLEFWLKYFNENPGLRFVSDGNARIAAVPKSAMAMVDEASVRAAGVRLQPYSLQPGSGGGTLSVENRPAGTASLSVESRAGTASAH